MPVTCPHCSTRYTLPEALLGPGGARVRCPRCREPFSVGPGGSEVLPLPAVAGNGDTAPAPNGAPEVKHAGPPVLPSAASLSIPDRIDAVVHASFADPESSDSPPVHAANETAVVRDLAPDSPAAIARAVLDDLDAHSGGAIAASNAQGRLFREFGAVIAEAFEFYRRRVGSGADPAPFRAALRERWGVDLEPGNPPKRLI